MRDLQWWDYSDLKADVQAAIADTQATISRDMILLGNLEAVALTAEDLSRHDKQ